MLARVNRLLTPDDFRGVLRRGKRHSTHTMSVSSVDTAHGNPARFGFVVTKKVGNAVTRNVIRRRLKAIAREMVDGGVTGVDVVARALPASVNTDWATLRQELRSSLKGVENS